MLDPVIREPLFRPAFFGAPALDMPEPVEVAPAEVDVPTVEPSRLDVEGVGLIALELDDPLMPEPVPTLGPPRLDVAGDVPILLEPVVDEPVAAVPVPTAGPSRPVEADPVAPGPDDMDEPPLTPVPIALPADEVD